MNFAGGRLPVNFSRIPWNSPNHLSKGRDTCASRTEPTISRDKYSRFLAASADKPEDPGSLEATQGSTTAARGTQTSSTRASKVYWSARGPPDSGGSSPAGTTSCKRRPASRREGISRPALRRSSLNFWMRVRGKVERSPVQAPNHISVKGPMLCTSPRSPRSEEPKGPGAAMLDARRRCKSGGSRALRTAEYLICSPGSGPDGFGVDEPVLHFTD